MSGNEKYEMQTTNERCKSDPEMTKTKENNAMLVKFLIGVCVLVCIALIVCVLAVIIVSDNAAKIVKSAEDKYNSKTTTNPGHMTTSAPLHTKTPGYKYGVCKTEHCKMRADKIKSIMNLEADPCEDFHEYTCGGWRKNTEIPADKNSIFVTSSSGDIIRNRSRDLLDKSIQAGEPEAIKKRKTLYTSCLNTNAIDNRGLKAITDLFKTYNFSWPIIDSTWSESTTDLETQIVRYSQQANSSLLWFYVIPDPGNTKKKILEMRVDTLRTLNGKINYNTTEQIDLIREYMTNISNVLAPGRNHSKDIDDVINYEIGASKLLYDPGEEPEVKDSYKRLTLKDLNNALSKGNINVESAVKNIMSYGSINITLTSDASIFIEDLNKTILNAEYTATISNRTLLNVMGFKLIATFINSMPKELRDIQDEYNRRLYGKTPAPRWHSCVNGGMNYVTTRMYVEKFFPSEEKKKVNDQIKIMQGQMHSLLALNEWMDESTLTHAIEKSDAMKAETAYPSWIMNDTFLDIYYSKFVFDINQTLENSMTVNAETFANQIREYLIPENLDWGIHPLAENAFYSQFENKFVLLVGILMPPYYDTDDPMYLNYGGNGDTIGHETIHGFDNNGRNVNKDGRIVDWWSKQSREAYGKRAQCIVDQFSQYKIEEINKTLNAKLTLGEDIADAGGIKLAYLAYRSWVTQRGREEDKLPGLDLTPDQMLFINRGHTYCSKRRKHNLLDLWESNSHTTERFRISGAVVGYKGFIDAFNCSLGSFMNPKPDAYCKLF